MTPDEKKEPEPVLDLTKEWARLEESGMAWEFFPGGLEEFKEKWLE